jgi:hypothetical protein
MSAIFSITIINSIQYYFRSEEPEYQLEDALKYSGNTGNAHKSHDLFLARAEFKLRRTQNSMQGKCFYQIYLIDAQKSRMARIWSYINMIYLVISIH